MAEYASSDEEQRKLIGERLSLREGAILRQIVSLKEKRQHNMALTQFMDGEIKGAERGLQDLEHRPAQESTTQAQICRYETALAYDPIT